METFGASQGSDHDLSNNRSTFLGLFAVGVAFLGYHLLTFWSGQRWGGDSAQYIIHALNLIHGQPYASNYVVAGEDFPAYPPMFPILLMPVLALTGVDWYWLKLPGVLCWLGQGLVWWRFLGPRLGQKEAWLFLVGILFLPSYTSNSQDVVSEATFSFFITCSLALVISYHGYPRARNRAALALGLLCMALSILTRSVGVALLPSIVLFFLLRKQWPAALTSCGFAAAAFLTQWAMEAAGGGYIRQLGGMSSWFGRARAMILPKTKALLETFYPQSGWSETTCLLVLVILFALPVWGVARDRWRKRQLNLTDIFLPAYLATIFVWPFDQGARFFIPIAPWLIFFFLEGWGLFLADKPWVGPVWARKGMLAFLAVMAVAYLAISVGHASLLPKRDLGLYQEGIDWIQANTGPGDHYLSRRQRGLALMTGRTGAFYNPYALTEDQAKIERLGLNLIVINKKRKEEAAIVDWATHQGGFALAWENQVMAVYRKTP